MLPDKSKGRRYREWLNCEARGFPARYISACERSEKKGQYIATELLASGRYSFACTARPKFYLASEGENVFEPAENRRRAPKVSNPASGKSVHEEEDDRRHVPLPIYRLEVIRKAQLVHKSSRAGVDLIADLLESKRMRLALRSPFICHLVDCFKDHCNLYIVTPDCRAGTLRQHIAIRVKSLSELGAGWCFGVEEVRFISAQLVLALEYLEKVNIVHRDIRSENVQFDYTGYVCLTDFSCAKRLEDRAFSLIGCPSYMAPEMLQFLLRVSRLEKVDSDSQTKSMQSSTRLHPYSGYSNSVDYWALGLVIYEMTFGQLKFTTERNLSGLLGMMDEFKEMAETSSEVYKQQQQPQQQKQQRSFKLTSINQSLTDLISGLLSVRPNQRLGCSSRGVKEIKGHAFFATVSFASLHYKTLEAVYKPSREASMYQETQVHIDDVGCDEFEHFADKFDEF